MAASVCKRHSHSWSCSCRNDVSGARDAGCYAWLWGVDVCSFDEVARRVLHRGEVED